MTKRTAMTVEQLARCPEKVAKDSNSRAQTDYAGGDDSPAGRTRVAVIVENEDGMILVRKRGPHDKMPRVWEPPNGGAGSSRFVGTSSELCDRVLRASTSLKAETFNPVAIYNTPDGIIHLFHTKSWYGTVRHERGHGSWYWLDRDALSDELERGEVFGPLSDWWEYPIDCVRSHVEEEVSP